MNDDEIAKRAMDFQKRGRDYRLVDIPAYVAWSRRKVQEGELPALIAHLDATSMWLVPEDVAALTDVDFDEMLAELRSEFGE